MMIKIRGVILKTASNIAIDTATKMKSIENRAVRFGPNKTAIVRL